MISGNKVILNVQEVHAHDARGARVTSLLSSLLTSLPGTSEPVKERKARQSTSGTYPESGPNRGLHVGVRL